MSDSLLLRIASLVDRATFGVFHDELEKMKKGQKEAAESSKLMADGWNQIKNAALAYFSISALKQMGEAALEEAKILDRLRFKVEQSGESWAAASAKVEDHANSFAGLGVDYREAIDLTDRFMTSTGDLEKAMGLTTAAIRTAAQTGRPLNEVMDKMQTLLTGVKTEMRGYGVEVDAAAAKSDNARETLELLIKQSEGFEEIQDKNVRTISQLRAEMQNLTADAGGPLITMFTELVGQGGNLRQSLGQVIAFLMSGVGPAFNFVRMIIEGLTSQVSTLMLGFHHAGKVISLLFAGDFKGAMDAAKEGVQDVRLSWDQEWDAAASNFDERQKRIQDSIADLWESSTKAGEQGAADHLAALNDLSVKNIIAAEQAAKARETLTRQLGQRLEELTRDEFDFKRQMLDEDIEAWKKAGVEKGLIEQLASEERKRIAKEEADAKAEEIQRELEGELSRESVLYGIEERLASASGESIDRRRQRWEDEYQRRVELAAGNKEILEQLELEHLQKMGEFEAQQIEMQRSLREEDRDERLNGLLDSWEEEELLTQEEYERRLQALRDFFTAALAEVEEGSDEERALKKKLLGLEGALKDKHDKDEKKKEIEKKRQMLQIGKAFGSALVQQEGSIQQRLNAAGRSAAADAIRTKLLPMAVGQVFANIPPPWSFALAGIVTGAMEALASKVESGGGGGGGGAAFAAPGGPTTFVPETGGAYAEPGGGAQAQAPVQITVVAWNPQDAAEAVAKQLDDIHSGSIRTRSG